VKKKHIHESLIHIKKLVRGLIDSGLSFFVKHVRPERFSTRVRRGVSIGAGILILGAVVAVAFSLAHHANAFNLLDQTDWSGGQGTNPTNQYSDATNVDVWTAGEIRLGSVLNTDWCNTTHCDNNWSRRQVVNLSNAGNQQTDAVVTVNLSYHDQMRTDFGDVRFVNQAGDTEYAYYLASANDGVSAAYYVKIPSLATGDTSLYAYYGNNNETTISDRDAVMTFWDHFSDFNTGDTPPYGSSWTSYWWDPPPRFEGGHAILSGSLYPQATIPRGSNEYVLEVEATIVGSSLPNWTCNSNSALRIGNYPNYLSLDVQFPCNDSTQLKWGYSYMYAGGNGYYPQTDAERRLFSPDQFVRFRAVYHQSGGLDWYYSINHGESYTHLGGSANSDMGDVDLYLYGGSSGNFDGDIASVNVYNSAVSTQVNFGSIERQGGKAGILTSVIEDIGAKPYFGNILIETAGQGDYSLRVRSAAQADMSDATDFANCNDLADGAAVVSSKCVAQNQRYIQYRVYLGDDAVDDLAIQRIALEYGNDAVAPSNPTNLVIRRAAGREVIAPGGWISKPLPFFSWDAASDNVGGSGLQAYCLYFGSDQTADPATTQGRITGASPVDTGGACAYAVTQTELDTAIATLDMNNSNIDVGETFYLTIRTLDNAGNLSQMPGAQTHLGIDNRGPEGLIALSGPSGYIKDKNFTINWSTSLYGVPYEQGSGFAGLKYCVLKLSDGYQGCGLTGNNEANPNHWYGSNHGSGYQDDPTDVLPIEQRSYTMQPFDYDRLDDNTLNAVLVGFVDNAGNFEYNNGDPGSSEIIVNMSQQAPSTPLGLQVTPGSSSTNAFAFSWSNPSSFVGPASAVTYCWTVNEVIASDAHNCTWTQGGVHSLASGAYATKQGVNTLYLMAKNQAGNYSTQNVAHVDFTANTAAPGAPANFDISDLSVRATSTWKLAMSWAAPQLNAGGIDTYRIFRSTDNVTFSEVGNTTASNLSFIDTNLTQITYYYKVEACDTAGACSVFSNVESKKPTGRFTAPATLVSGPSISGVSTHKATIGWTTNRDSDSKIAIGTSSGSYAPEETGNSVQSPSHKVELANLQAGTTYYFVMKWTDEDGNIGVSPEYSFSTIPAPSVGEVNVTQIGVSTATINLTISHAASVRLYYGQTDAFGGAKELNTALATSTYSFPLADLQDGTRYVFKLNGFDADGKEYPEQGTTYSFTTLALPKITNLRFQTVEDEPSSTQKVTWDTNVAATSELSYSQTGGQPVEIITSALTTKHEVIIRDLVDDKAYSLIARSRDAVGNLARSDTQALRTALDTRPPRISEVSIEAQIKGTGGESNGQVVVAWHTDEPATSQVAFNLGSGGGTMNYTAEDARLTTEHVVVISDLSLSSVYQVQTLSRDRATNTAKSDTQTVIIGRGTDSVFSIIFGALQRIFGVKL